MNEMWLVLAAVWVVMFFFQAVKIAVALEDIRDSLTRLTRQAEKMNKTMQEMENL